MVGSEAEAVSKAWAQDFFGRRRTAPRLKLRGRDACQQRGEALAPAPPQIQAQNLLAAVGAADGADDQQPGAQRHQPRRLILSNLAFEVGDEVEQETDQAESGFGAIEGVQAEAASAKVLLEFIDAVFALGGCCRSARSAPGRGLGWVTKT